MILFKSSPEKRTGKYCIIKFNKRVVMRVRQTNGLRLSTEFIDKVNPTKNRYKERPIFDLIDFLI